MITRTSCISTINHAIQGVKNSDYLNGEILSAGLPPDTLFSDDIWDIGPWRYRADLNHSLKVDFGVIGHNELKNAAKIYLLNSRVKRKSRCSNFSNLPHGLAILARIIAARSINDIRTSDIDLFGSSHFAYPALFGSFFRFLRENYNVKIDITRSKTAAAKHGKTGTEAGKERKLVDDEALFELLKLNSRPEPPQFDRLMVNALAINVCCGFRMTELLTLPVDCLIETNGELLIRNFTTKGGVQAPRPVHPTMASVVREAIATIKELTNDGRMAAQNWCRTTDPDWRRVGKDPGAVVYFSQKILHRWTADPDNRIINPEAAWHRHRGWIDVLGTLKSTGSVKETLHLLRLDQETFTNLKLQQEASCAGRAWLGNRKIRTAWATDTRVCNMATIFKIMGYASSGKLTSDRLSSLVNEALDYQLIGQIMPMPVFSEYYKRKYVRTPAILLQDELRRPVLLAEDALFALPANFVGSHSVDTCRWQCLDIGQVAKWFSGMKSQASIFSRYNIIDSRTGLTATFTSHAIRHWFETQLQRGGITDLQAAKIMNRKTVKSGSVYNQTSNAEKRQMLADGINDGSVCGALPDAMKQHNLTKEEAEEILASRLMHINIMPHGFCMQNLAMEACPHNMSCFAAECETLGKKSACIHLLVDLNVESQVRELRRERSNALALVESMSDDYELDDSPQIDHFRAVASSIDKLLNGDEL